MWKRSWWIVLILVALVTTSTAQSPGPRNGGPSLDLLDRGAPAAVQASDKVLTHTGSPTATLANLAGTPGVTAAMIMTAAPAPTMAGMFHGYFFAPGVDFPTSYHPFFVTGAYAFKLGPFFAPVVLGAGVAPGPFTSGAGTWAAFTAMPVATPTPFSAGMLFGGMTVFSHSPAISVPAGFGVACGYDNPGGGGLGGLTLGTGGGKPLSLFIPPGPGSGLGPIAAAPATYVVGCFITGATVPVELQGFHIE